MKDVASAYVLRPLQQYELSFNLEEQDKSEQKDTWEVSGRILE